MWRLLAAFLLLVLIGGELFLPSFAEQAVREAAHSEIPEAERVEVQLRSFPALRLLQGVVEQATIEIIGAELDGVRVARIVASGRGVRVDKEALQHRRVEVLSADELQVRFEFEAKELAAALEAAAGGWVPVEMELTPPDAVRVVGRVEFLGETLRIGLDGHFEVASPTGIRLVPDGVILLDAWVPAGLIDEITGGWGLEVDVGEMPLALHIERVFVADGRMIVDAAWVGEGDPPAADR